MPTFVLLLALLAANFPFFSRRRLFFLLPAHQVTGSRKSLWWVLLELILGYLVFGVAAWGLENLTTAPHTQSWEFFAVTVCLFLVCAFPGFTVRYIWHT